MKAVVLAGGNGRRMGALTDTRPKPLLKVGGKELIRHTLDSLPQAVIDEYVIVTGYLGQQISTLLGDSYNSKPITYLEQESTGTGGALLSARKVLVNESLFVVSNADDIFDAGELHNLPTNRPTYTVTHGVPQATATTGALFDGDGLLLGRHPVTHGEMCFFGTGLYVLPQQVFARPFVRLSNGEYSIPHSLHLQPFPVYVHQISRWLPVNTPQELQFAEQNLKEQAQN